MKRSAGGFTLIELVVAMAIMSIIIATMIPLISEPIFHGKIRGSVAEAKEVVSACHLVRMSPIATSQDSATLFVTKTYGPSYTEWTNASVLASRLSDDYALPVENAFGRPYLFKMTEKTCAVAVELDSVIDGWEGFQHEVTENRSRIIVSIPARSTAAPSWVTQQNRILTGETVR